MNPSKRQRSFLIALVAAAAVAATGGASTASAGGAVASELPPNNVYTCAWIAAHPVAAAQARVTCDPSIFVAAVSSPIAGPAAAILGAPDTVDATGCGYVPPLPTTISPGVFAWSGWKYSHEWSYKALNSPAYYTWYIQKPGPTTVVYGPESDTLNHSIGLGVYNNFRWGAQNHIYPTQHWYVCWYD